MDRLEIEHDGKRVTKVTHLQIDIQSPKKDDAVLPMWNDARRKKRRGGVQFDVKPLPSPVSDKSVKNLPPSPS